MVGGTWVEVLSFLTVNVDIELEILVVTSTMLDVFTGTFKGVGFVVLGLGFVTPAVELTVDDSGLVLSVVVVMLVYSGCLVVFVVVLVILVGFNFVVVDDDGLAVVDLLTVVLAVVDLAVVVLIVDDFVVVFEVVFGVVVFVVAVDTF